MRTNWQVGDRVRAAGEEGTITEVLETRGQYRVKLDSGRGICIDEKLVLSPNAAPVAGAETPEPSQAVIVKDKAVRGPRSKK